jgi:hypothetical protein
MMLNVFVVNISTICNNRNYSTKYYVHIHDLSRLKDKLFENRSKFKSLCITATNGTDEMTVGYACHHSV